MKRMPRFKPGDRVVIARGPGAGLAGTVCAPRPNDPVSTHVWVQFDREPGTRYAAPIAGLDYEAVPKKPRRPSVRRALRRRVVKAGEKLRAINAKKPAVDPKAGGGQVGLGMPR